jgi:DNA-directed RNA polymerase specialized sigma24 family protein
MPAHIPTDEQVEQVMALMRTYLRRRWVADCDVDDPVQNAVIATYTSHAEKFADVGANAGFFKRVVWNEWLMKLRSERRRRDRERRVAEVVTLPARPGVIRPARDAVAISEPVIDPSTSEALAVPGLTPLQRRYLCLVLVERVSAAKIAEAEGKTERAVRAVLQRAVREVRIDKDLMERARETS